MVDDIGLDLIVVLPPSSRRQARLPRSLALNGFESYAIKKKNHTKWCGFFLVDDIGLDLHFALWAKLRFASVQPSAAALVRAAFNLFEPYL